MSKQSDRARRGTSTSSRSKPRRYPASTCTACGAVPFLHAGYGVLDAHHLTTCKIAGRADRRIAADIRAALAQPEAEYIDRPLDPAEVDDLDLLAADVPSPTTASERAAWQVGVSVWVEDGQRHVLRIYAYRGIKMGALLDSARVKR